MKLFPPNRRLYIRAVAFLLISVVVVAVVSQFHRTRAATPFTVNSLGDTPDALVGDDICADAGGQCTLRAAIMEGNFLGDNNVITFSVTGTINLSSELPGITNMTINGPGSSQLTVRRNTGGDYRIFFISAFTASISGLTVTNGKTANGTAGQVFGNPGGDGGGILVGGNGTVFLNDLVVTGNRTGNGGPGGTSTGGWGGSGGGIAGTGLMFLTNVTVSNNITGNGVTGASGGSGGRGGGIFFSGSSISMTNCRVIGNTTGNGAAGTNGGASGGGGGDGGGIFINSGSLQMSQSFIGSNNSGDANFGGTGGNGGGLMTMPGAGTTLTDVSVSNNTTGDGGGGVTGQGGRGGAIANHGNMVLKNVTLDGNVTGTAGASGGDSGGIGGGLFNGNVILLLNTTVSGNRTGGFNAPGGGVHNNGSALSLVNSTVTGNTAVNHVGNGLYQSPFTGGTTFIRNTIVAQNIGGPDTFGNFSSIGPNLIGNADDSTGFTSSDLKGTTAAPLNPQIGPLADNGGPTRTHALLPGSPALDAGNNDVANDVSGLLQTDQRGATRFVDSPDADSIATVDLGSVEFHQTLQAFANQTTTEDTPLILPFAVGDTGPAVISVTATSTHLGLVSNANLVITGSNAVRTLTITPTANQSGTTIITVTANLSGGGIVNRSFTLTVLPVNDRPTFIKGADQTINEDSGAQTITNWASGLNAGPNETGQTLSFIVSPDFTHMFTVLPAISPSGTLTYTPAPNAYGSTQVSVQVKDSGGSENGGQDTSAIQTFMINLRPVNDPPTFTKGPDQTVVEDAGFQNVFNWATNIRTGPDNESDFLNFIVTNNTNPSLFAVQPGVDNSLRLFYMPAANASGVADITIVAKDSGGTANGGVDTSAPQTFRITVTPVNDGPIHGFSFFVFTNQQTPLVFSAANSNALTVADVDAGNNAITVSLTVAQGTLTMGSKTGLSFTVGDGTDDTTMTFSGTVTAINAGMNGLTFKPNNGFSGTTTFQFVSNDNGHSGPGGPKTTSSPFTIQVLSGGRFVFNTSNYGVNENGGTATITVLRSGGSAGVTSVTAATSGGTATAGSSCTTGVDYLPAVHTFTWASGDTSARTFAVTICNDSVMEGDETINLTLDSPEGTGSLGTTATAVLTIGTDDGPVLLFNPDTQEAIALDLVNLTRDPFSLTNPFNMSSDQRRRLSLFVWQTAPLGSNEVASVTATLRDDEFRVYQLPVEALIPVPEVPGVTQVVVRLPDSVIGAPRDMLVKVTVKGLTTNEAFVHITAP